MKGQRSKTIRWAVVLLLCAVLLSVLIGPVVAAVENVQQTPESGPAVRTGPQIGADPPGDDGGGGDPTTIDGDPDDYDWQIFGTLFWTILVTSAPFRVI